MTGSDVGGKKGNVRVVHVVVSDGEAGPHWTFGSLREHMRGGLFEKSVALLPKSKVLGISSAIATLLGWESNKGAPFHGTTVHVLYQKEQGDGMETHSKAKVTSPWTFALRVNSASKFKSNLNLSVSFLSPPPSPPPCC